MGAVEVTEVSEEGAVLDLKVVNKSPGMVLILDGEELVGAKQNRIVNTTILIAEDTTMVIPVSCVEQGRWSYDSPRFASREPILPNRIRAQKAQQVQYSLRQSREFRANQGAIEGETGGRLAAESRGRERRFHSQSREGRKGKKMFVFSKSRGGRTKKQKISPYRSMGVVRLSVETGKPCNEWVRR